MNKVKLDNILLTIFIVDYFGIVGIDPSIEKYFEINIKSYVLFIYNKRPCGKSLFIQDLIRLLDFGFCFTEIRDYLVHDLLIDPYYFEVENLSQTGMLVKCIKEDTVFSRTLEKLSKTAMQLFPSLNLFSYEQSPEIDVQEIEPII